MSHTNIRDIADYLTAALSKEGVVIQRYDSYSTSSIYLKLDYGVCNSVRISDHPGKKYLKYRYNIGTYVEKYQKTYDGYKRYYYRADKAKNLVKKILDDRKEKIDRYGKDRYESYMRKNIRDNSGNVGFWRQAKLITMEECK